MSFPFSSRTILGWYFTLFMQCQCGVAYTLTIISVISYYVGCCFYIFGICDHVDYLISSMQEDVDQSKIDRNAFSRAKSNKNIKEKLSRIVELHNKIFE